MCRCRLHCTSEHISTASLSQESVIMYSVANSLSPMVFHRGKKGKKGGDRMRSRSMENVVDSDSVEIRNLRARTAQPAADVERPEWKELSSVKSMSPVVACVLPTIARDFVCSALLAVGATPLILEG